MDVIGAQLTSCGTDPSNMLKNAGGGQRNRCFDIAKGI